MSENTRPGMKDNLFLKVALAAIAALLALNLLHKPETVHAQQNHVYAVLAIPDTPEGSMGNRRLAPSFQVPGAVTSAFCPAFTVHCYIIVDTLR